MQVQRRERDATQILIRLRKYPCTLCPSFEVRIRVPECQGESVRGSKDAARFYLAARRLTGFIGGATGRVRLECVLSPPSLVNVTTRLSLCVPTSTLGSVLSIPPSRPLPPSLRLCLPLYLLPV